MCRFKFRLWNCCRSAEVSWTAELNKSIKQISGYSAMLWPLFVLLYSSLHTNPTKTALSLKNRQHSCLPCQRWGSVARKNSGNYRRDCFPTAPSMRFFALSLSLFVGWGSVCALFVPHPCETLGTHAKASLPCLPLPLHQCLQFSECFKTIKYQG